MRYLLDSNTYIQAKNFHYNMNFCPAYWEWLDLKYLDGDIGSIKSVYEELYQSQNGDELSDWVRERRDQFVDIDDNVLHKKNTGKLFNIPMNYQIRVLIKLTCF